MHLLASTHFQSIAQTVLLVYHHLQLLLLTLSDGSQVHVHDVEIFLVRDFMCLLASAADAGIIDANVETPELSNGLGNAAFNVCTAANVKREGQNLHMRMLLLELRDKGRQCFLVNIVESKLRHAMLGEM